MTVSAEEPWPLALRCAPCPVPCLLSVAAFHLSAGGYAVQLDLDADMGVGAEEPDGRGNVRAVGTAAPLPPLPAGWESAVSHRQPDVTSTPQRAAASVIGTDPVRTASRAQGVPWQPLQRPGASTGAVGSGDSASGAAAAVAPGLQRRDALHGEQQRTKDTGAPGVQSRGSMEAQQSQTTEPHAHQAEGLLVDLAGHCSAAVCHHWAQQQRQQQQHHLPSTCAAHDAAAFLQLAAPASSASRVGEHAVAGTSIQRSCTHASNGGFNNVACVRDTDTCPAIHVSWQPQRREPSGVFPGSGLSLGAGVAEPQVLGAPQPVSTANGKGNWNSNGRPWMAGLLMGITLGFALGGGAVGALVIRSWVRGPGSHGYTASAVNRLGGVAAEPAAAYPGMDQYDGDMYGSMGETAEELAGAAGRPGAGPSRSSQSRGGVGALVQRTLSGVERVLQTPRRQRGAAEGGSPGSGGGGRRLGSIEEEEQGGGQGLMEGSGEAGGAVGAQGGGVAAALASLSPSVLKLLAAGGWCAGGAGACASGCAAPPMPCTAPEAAPACRCALLLGARAGLLHATHRVPTFAVVPALSPEYSRWRCCAPEHRCAAVWHGVSQLCVCVCRRPGHGRRVGAGRERPAEALQRPHGTHPQLHHGIRGSGRGCGAWGGAGGGARG